MLSLLGCSMVSCRFNGRGKKEGAKNQTTNRQKVEKLGKKPLTRYISIAALQIMISYTQVFKTVSLESSDMLAVISKAPYGSQATGSQENSATAAHLLRSSFLEIILLL